jgi:hypothetical protein
MLRLVIAVKRISEYFPASRCSSPQFQVFTVVEKFSPWIKNLPGAFLRYIFLTVAENISGQEFDIFNFSCRKRLFEIFF